MSNYVLPLLGSVEPNSPILPNANFTWREALHNGERIPKDAQHIKNIRALCQAIQPLRVQMGKPWIVLSWYRPEPWNTQAGGDPRSLHKDGRAVDFYVPEMYGSNLYDWLNGRWRGGLGYYPDGRVHVDIGSFRRW